VFPSTEFDYSARELYILLYGVVILVKKSKIKWILYEVGISVVALLASCVGWYLLLTRVVGIDQNFCLALIVVAAMALISTIGAALWSRYERFFSDQPSLEHHDVRKAQFSSSSLFRRHAVGIFWYGVGSLTGLLAMGALFATEIDLAFGIIMSVISVSAFAKVVPIMKGLLKDMNRDC